MTTDSSISKFWSFCSLPEQPEIGRVPAPTKSGLDNAVEALRQSILKKAFTGRLVP